MNVSEMGPDHFKDAARVGDSGNRVFGLKILLVERSKLDFHFWDFRISGVLAFPHILFVLSRIPMLCAMNTN